MSEEIGFWKWIIEQIRRVPKDISEIISKIISDLMKWRKSSKEIALGIIIILFGGWIIPMYENFYFENLLTIIVVSVLLLIGIITILHGIYENIIRKN